MSEIRRVIEVTDFEHRLMVNCMRTARNEYIDHPEGRFDLDGKHPSVLYRSDTRRMARSSHSADARRRSSESSQKSVRSF